MKFFSIQQKEFLKRRQIASYRKDMRRVGIERHKNARSRLIFSKILKPTKIPAPKHFNLINRVHRKALLDFIDAVTTSVRIGKRVVIDFRDTTELSPCGTLYFVANVENLIQLYPLQLTCRLPRNNVVEQLFQHIGLLAKLGQSSSCSITAENVVRWHYATGIDASTSNFQSLLLAHGDAMGGEIARSELYDSMSEAITNTRKHAYPLYNDDETQWWMFSQALENKLTVVICDLGIGIPGSLLHKPELKDYFRKLTYIGTPKKHDQLLIQIATQTKRTSSKLPYRGKGLPQMLHFISSRKKGEFRVQSGYGYYYFDAEVWIERTGAYQQQTIGTLIQWTLPLAD